MALRAVSGSIAKNGILFAAVGASAFVFGCGGSGGGMTNTSVQTTPTVTTNAAVTASKLYATDTGTGTVDVYTANQSGAVSTITTLGITANEEPWAIAMDGSGNLYVGTDTSTGGAVLVFPSGATAASRTITLPNAGSPNSNQVVSMTTDSSGNLYVAGSTVAGTSGVTSSVASIFVYAPDATGAATPLHTVTGSATTLAAGAAGSGIEHMALDSSNNLYVAQGGAGPSGTVVMFPAGANGNVAPTLITSSTYSPTGVTLDAKDNIYISQGSEDDTTTGGGNGKYPSAIFVFAKGAVAGASPVRTITGTATAMTLDLYDIQVDSAGNIFVEQNATGHSQFLVYSATANGNVAPTSTLTPSRGSTIDSQFLLK